MRWAEFERTPALHAALRLPQLSAEEEQRLGRTVHEGCPEAVRGAIDLLVTHNLRLVIWEARQRRFRGSPADQFQAGVCGLVTAAQRYDGRPGNRFHSYALHWVRQALSREYARSRLVTLPDRVQQIVRAAGAVERLEPAGEPDGPGGALRFAAQRGLSRANMGAAQRAERPLQSLDVEVGGDGGTLGARLPEPGEGPEEMVVDAAMASWLQELVEDYLPPREGVVVLARCGLLTGRPLTYDEIARDLLGGVSKERARQVGLRGQRRLRRLVATKAPELGVSAV